MSFEKVTSAEWLQFVTKRAESLSDQVVADALLKFELVPGGANPDVADAVIHLGKLSTDGDLILSSWITVIDGDLHVDGKLSTKIEGGDGYVTLVVFGDVECGSIDHDWASIIVVTGDVIAKEWVFASREDSSFVIGGDFKTPLFIGADISVAVAGSVEIEYGYGYAFDLSSFADAYGAPQIHPKYGWRETALKLGIGKGRVPDEEQLMELLEERMATTGSPLLP